MGTDDSVDVACRRWEDFVKVWATRSREEKAEAVTLLAQGSGMDSATTEALRERLSRTVPEEHLSWAVFGVVLGRYMAQDELMAELGV